MELVLKDTGSQVLISNVVFGSAFNESLVHQVVTACFSNARQGTRAQKSRAEVSGSGKKPWRQKGTGRARSGSVGSPIWRSGGVTFAAKPKIYKVKINKKMYRGALRSIFSELVRQHRLIIMSEFYLETSKTKLLVERLKSIGLKGNNLLFLINELDRNLFLASRNLYKVKVCHVNGLDPCVLISFGMVLTTFQTIKSIEGILE